MLLCLPPASGDETSCVLGELAPFKEVQFEPVGRHYEVHFNCRGEKHSTAESDEDGEDDNEAVIEETPEEVKYLRGLDPKEWKHQDHYHVLGLQDRRFHATDRELKAAFRRKVLAHHPDKRATMGERVDDIDTDYFSCITRAYELLSNAKLRRSYDSVDPMFDDGVPAVTDKNKANFFTVFGAVFERNARWSIKPHPPALGGPDATEDEVNEFYNFWYSFESWREYSYLDEDDKEKGENRDERRWIDRENRAQRQKLKRDETKRIRQLVDNAMECDPRIRRFKEEAKLRKEEAKRRRQDEAIAKRLAEEAERRERDDAARREREQREKEEKAAKEREKKAREALKKEQKKQKKLFEALCAEAGNFAEMGSVELVRNLERVDQVVRVVPLEDLTRINEQMSAVTAAERQTLFDEAVSRVEELLQREKMETLQSAMKGVVLNGTLSASLPANAKDWSQEEVNLLVKAVNLFPAGTTDRWEVVSQYIVQHSGRGIKRTAKDVLNKAKNMAKSELGGRQDGGSCTANLRPAHSGEETIAGIDQEKLSSVSEVARAWSNEEQKLLEQALKTYPVSLGAERWDKIASVLPNRSKKECMKRYKELVETVKAKKAAVAAAAAANATAQSRTK
ncbi:dnaJsubfamily C member 2-like [Tropilaelaps mercedesae]|uniref:DnaJ homolog subfamily C member 2 n=1 Tax=Tropilaelaps mercedesae TaxID=418985 RepID=A0A1V9X6P9_9ACAR|nr:dnaJsubfamily C member 2-like [Tropilaelaps mercedesae]